MTDPLHREVFGALPGITGPTALAWRDEEERLAAAALELARAEGRATTTVDDIERAYRERILPQKLAMDAEYLRSRSVRGDLAILGTTIGTVQGRAAARPCPDGPHVRDLAHFVEWGAPVWKRMVSIALAEMGDLHGRRVLEIGARSGRMSSLFALHGATVVGIDVTSGFEAEARAEAARHGVADRLEFRVDDGRLSSVQGETFDIVFTKSVLVVIPDRIDYLRSVHDCLRPGGMLVAIENGRGSPVAWLLRRLRRVRWDANRIDYLDEEGIDEVRSIMDVRRVERSALPPVYLIVARCRA